MTTGVSGPSGNDRWPPRPLPSAALVRRNRGNRKLALKPAVARYHGTQALPSRPEVS
jgi:hypothetical protein